MAVTCGFYNSIGADRRYNSEQMSALFDGIINDGVFMSIGDAMVVSASSGMNVSIGSGRAWFNRTWTNNDAAILLTVEPSEVVLNRIDAVVLEVNSDEAVRANSIKIVKGTPGSVPIAPIIANTEFVHQYPLCLIYIAAGVTEITQANITNKVGTEVCPFVTGILETVNIDTLLSQWEAEFNDWFATFEGILDENTAGNLLNLITEHKAEKATDAELGHVIIGTGLDVDVNGIARVETDIARFKKGSSAYTNDTTSQAFTDAFCDANSLVTIVITSATPPQGVWSVESGAGAFTITSTVAESADITFDYYLQKAVG